MKNIDNFQLRPLIGGSPFKKASHRLNKSIKNSELRTLKELKELKGKDKFEQKTKAYLQDKIKTTARSDFSEIQTKLFEALKDGKTDETQLFTNIKEWGTEVYSDYVEGIKKESKANVLNRQKLGIVRSYIDNLKETLKEVKGDKPTYDRENTKKFWASIPKNIAGELKAAILKDVDKTGGAFRFDKKDTGLPYTIIKTNSDPPKYFELINTISEEDKGSTPKEYEDNKVVLGEGAFGKVRLARELNIQNGSVGEFCAVKKLKSSTEHQKEVDSYKTVPDSDGFLKLDGEASIPEDESRQYKGYIFQPILDIDLDEVMMKINKDPRNQQIKNEFERYCAYSFLKSAQTMQENS
ncbi:MAG: hypothetical protein VXX85_00045, partial [Candidatus Margulisiibacteriota bacterium]|nr:hypothetical protein [Candidatus Margulisiibacteriota bacterium]